MKQVILGAGAAGINAAKTIRKLHPDDDIIIVSADRTVHSRCMLHKYLSGERSEAAMSFIPDDFFESHRIQWLSGRRAVKITPEKNTVTLEDGEELQFDNLLIATGSFSTLPEVGSLQEANNVFGLRHLSDAQKIRERLAQAEQVVIIGSGLVGMDAAYGLLEQKKQVTVVEIEDRIMPMQLDKPASDAYKKLFEAAGCKFLLNTVAVGTKDDGNGNITHVTVSSREHLPCDLVISATGVRPEISFLEGSGIETFRGIDVNGQLCTNFDNIYAAGDVTGLSALWPNAVKQGTVAAQNMCGEYAAYIDFISMNTMNFYGLPTVSVSEVAAMGDLTIMDGDQVYTEQDRNNYRKVVVRDGYILAVLIQGDISHCGIWKTLVRNRVDVGFLNEKILDVSFTDFYHFGDRGQFEWEKAEWQL